MSMPVGQPEVNTMDALAQQPAAAMSPDQAHALLGKRVISRASFYAAINRGEIPHIRLNKRIIIPRARFLAWLEGKTENR